jgi:DNA-binding CsgD family transcriptional regulator
MHTTPRESEIIALVSQALLNKEIASVLEISEWTVKQHLKAIYKKWGARNRVHLVLMYNSLRGEP